MKFNIRKKQSVLLRDLPENCGFVMESDREFHGVRVRTYGVSSVKECVLPGDVLVLSCFGYIETLAGDISVIPTGFSISIPSKVVDNQH